jgi:hypothetical protein
MSRKLSLLLVVLVALSAPAIFFQFFQSPAIQPDSVGVNPDSASWSIYAVVAAMGFAFLAVFCLVLFLLGKTPSKKTTVLAPVITLMVLAWGWVLLAPENLVVSRVLSFSITVFLGSLVAIQFLFVLGSLGNGLREPTSWESAFFEGIGNALAFFPPPESENIRSDLEIISQDLEAVLHDFAVAVERHDRYERPYSTKEKAHVV